MDPWIHGSFLCQNGQNITIVGTMKHNRKGIPKELTPIADREQRSVMHGYNTKEKIMLVSYIDKKKL